MHVRTWIQLCCCLHDRSLWRKMVQNDCKCLCSHICMSTSSILTNKSIASLLRSIKANSHLFMFVFLVHVWSTCAFICADFSLWLISWVQLLHCLQTLYIMCLSCRSDIMSCADIYCRCSSHSCQCEDSITQHVLLKIKSIQIGFLCRVHQPAWRFFYVAQGWL